MRFVLVVSVLTLGFNTLFYFWLSELPLFDSYLELNAGLSAWALTALGQEATMSGTTILGSRFSLDIHLGCDAIQPSAFFGILVLASPLHASLFARLSATVVGVVALLTLNLVRITALYFTGVYFPRAFDAMHMDVWQAAFILLPVLLWLVWVRRHMGPMNAVRPDGPG